MINSRFYLLLPSPRIMRGTSVSKTNIVRIIEDIPIEIEDEWRLIPAEHDCCGSCHMITNEWIFVEEYVKDNWSNGKFNSKSKPCICFDGDNLVYSHDEVKSILQKFGVDSEIEVCNGKLKISYAGQTTKYIDLEVILEEE